MIESYLDSLTKEKEEERKISITPLVESLSGVIDLPADFDYRKDYQITRALDLIKGLLILSNDVPQDS